MEFKLLRFDKKTFDNLRKEGLIESIFDSCEEQLSDLFLIRNPQLKYKKDNQREFKSFKEKILQSEKLKEFGCWALFPEDKYLVHYLPEDLHLELRTARNKNLILKEEQEKFYQKTIGIAGLSIGSHAAFTIAMMGGGKNLKIADPDTLSASNLNRVRYDFTQIGKRKTSLVNFGVLKINPYSKIEVFKDGLSEIDIENFIVGSNRLEILIEEVDNISIKFLLRFAAKKNKIPVIMATDNGDNVIVDIERYDLTPNQPIFNGLVGGLTIEQFKSIPKDTLPMFVGNIVGIDLVTPRVFESLSEVGKTLFSWPQLGSAANMSGSILAYLSRQIANGSKIPSGKYDINIEKIFSQNSITF